MDYKFVGVDPGCIDTADVTYRITTPQDKPSITGSIDRIGLICPVVVKQADDRMIVISGFRRIQACRDLGRREIPCRFLPDDMTPGQCAEIAIADNLSRRSLNLVEQARCMRMLTNGTIEATSAQQIAETLGFSMNRALRAKLNVLLDTPENVQTGLVTEKISLPTALLLAEMAPTDADVIVSLFNRLPMGLNKQREVLVYLQEIALREGIPLNQIIEATPFRNVLDDEQLDGNLKARFIRTYLRKRRYPRLIEVENAFNHCVRELKLGGAIQIAPPPGFEGRNCTMTIRFDSMQELRQAQQKIAEALDHPMAGSLFDCL